MRRKKKTRSGAGNFQRKVSRNKTVQSKKRKVNDLVRRLKKARREAAQARKKAASKIRRSKK